MQGVVRVRSACCSFGDPKKKKSGMRDDTRHDVRPGTSIVLGLRSLHVACDAFQGFKSNESGQASKVTKELEG